MLLDEIKKANMRVMKGEITREAKPAFEQVISKCLLWKTDAKNNGKELTDNEVLAIIQKVIKECGESAEAFKSAGRDCREYEVQVDALGAFLPKQLSRDEIKELIEKLDDKSIPNVMKFFKTNYSGKCDMGLVSAVAKGK
jgi:uncharacterized protein YqeY